MPKQVVEALLGKEAAEGNAMGSKPMDRSNQTTFALSGNDGVSYKVSMDKNTSPAETQELLAKIAQSMPIRHPTQEEQIKNGQAAIG